MRLLAAALLVLALPLSPARAGQSYDTCTGFIDALPAVIGTQGTWCLRQDLSTAISIGRAIEVAANNVTIDCNQFKIGGLAGGPDSTATGVYASGRVNTTVRNCLIRGFDRAVYLFNADGALVEDVVAEGSYHYGIYVFGDNGTIRRNRVLDTGSEPDLGYAYGIYVQGATDVLDNTVNGVTRQDYVRGIGVLLGRGATVQGNRVKGIDGATQDSGILMADSFGAMVRDNHVTGPGDLGINCGFVEAIAMDNVISDFDIGVDPDCRSTGNVVQLPSGF